GRYSPGAEHGRPGKSDGAERQYYGNAGAVARAERQRSDWQAEYDRCRARPVSESQRYRDSFPPRPDCSERQSKGSSRPDRNPVARAEGLHRRGGRVLAVARPGGHSKFAAYG